MSRRNFLLPAYQSVLYADVAIDAEELLHEKNVFNLKKLMNF